MNGQPIKRAAVCAALVIVCLAGAGWLSTQRVAGQTAYHSLPKTIASYQPVPRPGLRNSFALYPLSTQELNLVLTHLQQKTGFVQMRFDEAGLLTIDDRAQIVGGSAIARELLLAAIDGKKSITLHSRNRSSEVIFARVTDAVNYIDRSNVRIEAKQIEIDFADFHHLHGHSKAVEAFDLGFTILHELGHAALELHDPTAIVKAAGDCERYVNRIRRELGLPERQQYVATIHWRRVSTSRPTIRIAKLVFAQTKPSREPEGRAKTKKFYLMWEVEEVGNMRMLPGPLKERTSIGVTMP